MMQPKRLKFGRDMRLTRQREFDHVFSTGRRMKIRGLTIIRLENDLGHPRLGISIGRKFGNAVERNRTKRKIREAFRLTQHQLASCDFICVPYRRAVELSVEDYKSILEKAGEPSKSAENHS